ncbi:MAG: helix-turn-helix domain-containing protein [Gammaproteobacteria bacterium]|nr:helix-turn-helix domain-containing protein [Gammaproteobacteria bacterium]MDH5653942.1 helix-turn-helix domain-containing protein [Gammaproteobacteria bacterium]
MLALLNTGKDNRAGHVYLALLTLAFSIDLGHEFLYQSRHLLNTLSIAFLDPVINLLYGPAFYLYVQVLTGDRTVARKGKAGMHLMPFGIGLVACFILPGLTPEQYVKLFYSKLQATAQNEVMVLAVVGKIALASVVSIGVYLVLSLRRLRHHAKVIRQQFSSIEQITLNWLRNLLLALSVLYLILIFDGFFSRSLGLDENVNRLLYLMVVAVIYTMGYLGLRQPVIFSQQMPVIDVPDEPRSESVTEATAKYKTSALDAGMSAALQADLQRHMETERPYLDSRLTLPLLAKQLSISPNYLSQVINERFGKNFFDFINDYRIEAAKQLLADTINNDTSIVSIAYDAGFNSKSAFYTAFKKHVGVRPLAYRQTLLDKTDPV